MMIRVLFVDDEEKVLDGMRRMLRNMRHEWDMEFARGAEEALLKVDKAAFDVIVSDMRMPGMDGAELLTEVRKRQPDTLRVILSGYSEEESILRTVGPAHRYLSKPCPSDVLIKTIKQAIGLREFVDSDQIRQMVNGLGHLPSPPAVVFKLLQCLDSSDATTNSVADIISTDIALTAQVMRVTNSAFFSLPTKATTPLQAVSFLGFDTIRSILLVSGILSQFEIDGAIKASFERLALNCLTIGKVARALSKAERVDTITMNHAECAGTLSHLGSLLLMTCLPKEFLQAAEACEHENTTIYEAERRGTGVGHAELGGYLLGLWGFASPIVTAVAYHHTPGNYPNDNVTPLTFVHAAQYLCSSKKHAEEEAPLSHYALDEDYLTRVGVIDRLPKWEEIAQSIKSKQGDI